MSDKQKRPRITAPIASTGFKPKNLETLKRVIQQDYGVTLGNDEANQLGFSMLKITRLAMGVFDRVEEKRSMEKSQL